jgi:TPR repeat protein
VRQLRVLGLSGAEDGGAGLAFIWRGSQMMRRSVSLGLAVLALACFAFAEDSGLAELKARAEKGEPVPQFLLGRAYLFATDGLKKDEATAAGWFRKAAEQGQVNSETFLAWMYEEGHGGLGKDDVQAAYWYRKAAEQGEPNAMRNLGLMCLDGRGGMAKDEAQGVSWFRKAAEKDDESAENYLGLMYEKGRGGLSQDVETAMYWYRKAADKGYASAQNNLAVIYLSSNPDLRNPRAALDYAQKATASFKNNPIFLSTLAAAYFAEGQFENAVTTQTRAIALVQPDKKDEYTARLDMYTRTWEANKREAKPLSTFPTKY